MVDKKSFKKSRSLATDQSKVEAKPTDKRAIVPKSERFITVEIWGRGNSNPLMRAFISEHKNQRTVKRTAAQWIELFREWKAQPRG